MQGHEGAQSLCTWYKYIVEGCLDAGIASPVVVLATALTPGQPTAFQEGELMAHPNRRGRAPRHAGVYCSAIILALGLLVLAACAVDTPLTPVDPGPQATAAADLSNPDDASGDRCGATRKGVGEIEIVWRGGNAPVEGNPDDPVRRAFAGFDLHEGIAERPAHGTFSYRVMAEDLTLHREVVAVADGIHVDPEHRRLWFTGTVVSDSKGCAGAPGGGHDSGCTDEGCDDDGCAGHDGGCGEDHDTTDGGCTGGHEDPGGGSTAGHGASGRFCRVGQRLIGKMHDGGSPGAALDGITWRWFLAEDPNLPSIEDLASWPHLCRKDILDGNLMVFVPRAERTRVESDG